MSVVLPRTQNLWVQNARDGVRAGALERLLIELWVGYGEKMSLTAANVLVLDWLEAVLDEASSLVDV